MWDEEELERLYNNLPNTPDEEVSPKDPPPKPDDDLRSASQKRFYARLEAFKKDGKPIPRLRHHALWLLHNCVSHPLLAVYPKEAAVELHELLSLWLNKNNKVDPRTLAEKLPDIKKPIPWMVHNAIAHPLIGLLPVGWAFRWHDKTAKKMEVKGWV